MLIGSALGGSLTKNLHLAKYRSKQTTPGVLASPGLDEDVSPDLAPHTLEDELLVEDGVVEGGDVVAHVARRVALVVLVVFLLKLVVHIDHQLVQVVHVFLERCRFFCRGKGHSIKQGVATDY